MAEDIRLAKGEDLDALAERVDELESVNSDSRLTDVENTKLQAEFVTELPSMSAVYDFDDGKPLFTVPVIGSSEKGTSTAVEDEDNGGYYQSIISTSGNIGSTSTVYSALDLSSIISPSATSISIAFDMNFVNNGRYRIAISDLDSLILYDSENGHYNYTGIAAYIFSSSNYSFAVNGSSSSRESFFNTWLHCEFEINMTDKTVSYTIYSKDTPTNIISGTADFCGDCDKITGIAAYTWVQSDTVYFDNISVTSVIDNVNENTVYIVNGSDGAAAYMYKDNEPLMLSGGLETRIAALEEQVAELIG